MNNGDGNGSTQSVETLRAVVDERNIRYEQRFQEQEKALAIAKESSLSKGLGYIIAAIAFIQFIFFLAEKLSRHA